ncbi:MAG: acyl transferase domain-containing protein [Myxococcota bacterium]|jgi:acyl transferase domain-containing protein/NAD(P)H-dependent flavin oxidoreductase YrpB (nitropropane dioxygenase family)/acyl carrier protein
MRVYIRPVPGLSADVRREVVEDGAELVDALDAWHVVRHPRDIESAPEGRPLWLIGSEAGGPCGTCAGLVLIRQAAASGRRWVIAGIGPRGMAASIAVGADGIVVGPELWLAGDGPLSEARRRTIRGAGGRDTVVLGELAGWRARVLQRGPIVALRALKSSLDASALQAEFERCIASWTAREDALVPAPQSIAGATTFERATTRDALRAVREAVRGYRADHPHHALRTDPLGTGSCLVQGPMANVSEGAPFAAAVAHAGALPCFALGALSPERAREVLAGGSRVPGPWGVGVIAFDVVPHRDAQLEAIFDLPEDARPAAVVLAGGSPGLARQLVARGVRPWLHTPSARLIADALDAGAAVVLEGREAGGHVGAMTSIGLWEEGLAIVEAWPGKSPMVVLAGGIGDPVTAAMAGAMASTAARAGARVLLQAGTAFFYTHEIAELGNITPDYQRIALAADETVLVGSSANLALRCVPNPFTHAVRALERTELRALGIRERRERLETHNLGRTRIAAKGFERSPGWPVGPRYRDVPPSRQRSEGAYTMGQGAVVERDLWTVAELVQRLTVHAASRVEGGSTLADVARVPAVFRARPAPRTDAGGIAIVGLGAILPRAVGVEAWWHALLAGVDAVGPIPADRWDPHRYWDPSAGRSGPARTSSMLAGVVADLPFDPVRFRLPPAVVPALDRSQQLALVAAAEAVAGGLSIDRRTAAVVLGNAMGGEHAKSLAVRVRFREIVAALAERGVLPTSELPAIEAALEADLDQRLPPVVADSMAGLLSNVVSGRVASWLDWMGGNHTVDAACAASLAAVGVAVEMLRARRCDTALTGGVDTDLSPETFVGFSRTQALSSTGSHPFAAGADGFVMGEGAGVFVLQRVEDALRSNTPIWAVIRGVGQSSDGRGRGITAPSSDGQRMAIHRATVDAGLSAGDVRVLEAHGTGTPLGDATEIATMAAWQGSVPTWIGSAKSMIGHLKGAAGAAGLLKAVLTVATGVLPPTLHAGPVREGAGSLRLPRTAVRLDGPYRVGVSAFGFGGTNHHVIVEAPPAEARRPALATALTAYAEPFVRRPGVAWSTDPTPLALSYGAATQAELVDRMRADRPSTPESAARAAHRAVVLSTDALREEDVARAARWLAEGASGALPDVFLGAGAARAPVLLVPGQGSQHPESMVDPSVFAAGAAVVGPEVDPAELAAGDPVAVHLQSVRTTLGWHAVLGAAGLQPVAALGHSLGEIGALVAAGWLGADTALEVARVRGEALADCPPGAMVAVDADPTESPPVGWTLAAHNAPGQVVWSGPVDGMDAMLSAHPRARRLPVARAYHSEAVAPGAEAIAGTRAEVAFTAVQVWSAADAAPMDRPLASLARAVTAPVRFVDTLTALAATVERPVFVELGPGRVLTGLARAILPHATAIALDPRPGHRIGSIRAAAALLAAGHAGLLLAAGGAWVRLAPALPLLDRQKTVAGPESWPARRTGQASAVPERSAFADEARRVQDLRIAALADPAQAERYATARAGLLDRLAAADAGESVALRSQAEVAPATPPEPLPPGRAHEPDIEAPTPVVQPAPSDLRAVVVDAVCTITGYPPDVLTDELDLEADLGVDSIKKLEILGLLQKRLGFQAEEADYARLNDAGIADLVRWLESRTAAPSPAPDAPTVAWVPAFDVSLSRPGSPVPHLPDDLPAIAQAESGWVVSSDALGNTPLAQVEALLDWVRSGPTPAPIRARAAPESAVAGFLASLVREWEVPLRLSYGPAVLSSTHGPSSGTLFVGSAGVAVRGWAPSPLAASAPLAAGPVIVASGGARGITCACLAALGDLHPRILCLGRSPATAAEVQDGLKRLTDAGATVRYARCDVGDADAVAAAVADARDDWGPITVVVHGAGVLRDGPAGVGTPAHAREVLGVKLRGAEALLSATGQDFPSLWVAFGSIVAAAGNPGQTLYGAANAALAAIEHPTAARSLCIGWTAWSGVGMAASDGIQGVLRARGVASLTPERGAAAFRALVDGPQSGMVLVTTQAPEALVPLPWPITALSHTAAGAEAHLSLSPGDPPLADHRVTGRPLVPAAVWIVAMAEAAALVAGRRGPWTVRDTVIHAPTFVDTPRTDIRLVLEARADGWSVQILAGVTVLVSATVGPGELPSPGPDALEPTGSAADLYRSDLLFHGRRWQVLDRAGHDGNGHAAARLFDATGTAEAIDGAHQLLCAWAGVRRGWLGLPIGADRWTVLPGSRARRIQLEARAFGDDVVATVRVADEDGAVVACADGVRLRRAAPWPADGPTLPLVATDG